jgi:hypothetical protein
MQTGERHKVSILICPLTQKMESEIYGDGLMRRQSGPGSSAPIGTASPYVCISCQICSIAAALVPSEPYAASLADASAISASSSSTREFSIIGWNA